MKLLMVLNSEDTYNRISLFVKPLGFDLICYYQVFKAMENIDEIDPHAIAISARDFPRHWKTMVQYVRNERSKEECPIILLKGDLFPIEEATKASYLGVSGIVAEALDNQEEVNRFQAILGRYLPVDERRRARRFHVEQWQRFGFVFTCPFDNTLVTGEIKDISNGGLSFLPDIPSLMKDITLNMKLEDCSLRVGDYILSPVCRLARTGRIVSLELLSMPEEERKTWNRYMDNLPLLGLKYIQEKHSIWALHE
ncbi:MAG: PilZ domain-containing protein [Treponema sp.]|jgi:hypothetical protein|nr:PilZ domain-containing protein [Treponema sp.]